MAQSLFDAGRERFNAGDYFAAHELWEDLWRETHGTSRAFVQGMVQVAVGLHHHSTGNVLGARSVLARGLRNMTRAAEPEFGCDFARWRSGLEQVLRSISGGGPPRVPKL